LGNLLQIVTHTVALRSSASMVLLQFPGAGHVTTKGRLEPWIPGWAAGNIITRFAENVQTFWEIIFVPFLRGIMVEKRFL
jgi:hypothetical protein